MSRGPDVKGSGATAVQSHTHVVQQAIYEKKCGAICLQDERGVSLFPSSFLRLDSACIMAVRRDGMTVANISSFLEMSGADREAGEIVNAAGIKISDPVQEPGYGRWVSSAATAAVLPKSAGTTC